MQISTFVLFLETCLYYWVVVISVSRVADGMSQLSRNTSGQLVSDVDRLNNWEQLINKNHLTVWRKPVPNSYLYEYKG